MKIISKNQQRIRADTFGMKIYNKLAKEYPRFLEQFRSKYKKKEYNYGPKPD